MKLGTHAMNSADAVAKATGEGWQIIRADDRGVRIQRGMRARLIVERPDGVVVRRAVSPRQIAVAALVTVALCTIVLAGR